MDHSYLLPGLSPLSSQARLVFLDQRGTGMSDAPLDETAIGFPLLLEDIEAVRLALGVDSIGILSHSWGSTLALHYALAYPNHVSSLVLISPVEPGTRFVEVAGRRRSERMTPTLLDSLRLLQQDPAFREGEPTLVNRWYRLVFTPLLSDPERDLDLGIRLSETTTRRGFEVMRLLGPTMPDPDLWGRLGGVRAPVLLVHGRADAYPVEMVLEMADSIEVGRAVVIEDAGHFPYIENPEALRAAVTAFWSGLEASN
jgi:proline iminopeptidase